MLEGEGGEGGIHGFRFSLGDARRGTEASH